MKIRQDSRWPNAHVTLREVYEARVPDGMSQAEFGATFGLGSQGMVWQYLNGYTPLNYDAAAKFARGLQCTIREISPKMADSLEAQIIPVLGRRARKVAGALVMILALPTLLQSAPSSSILHNVYSQYTLHAFRICRQFLRRLVEVLIRRRSSSSFYRPVQI